MQIFLEKIARKQTLTTQEAYIAMQAIVTNSVSMPKLAAFLAILHTRGEFYEELLGFIHYLRQQAITVNVAGINVIDTCGTGGDYGQTFNISTAAALLLASAGVKVAKHGGRSISSKCGSADVIDALGISMQHDPASVKTALAKNHFAFLYAPQFNPVFQQIALLRKELGIRTSFNLLGPLLNPVSVKRQLLGVYAKELMLPLAKVLCELGSEEVIVMHARDGLDEFSIYAPTDVVHLQAGNITSYTVIPEELGFKYAEPVPLQGGDAIYNAQLIEQIFSGECVGPQMDVVVLNAAAGFLVAGAVKTLADGVVAAREQIVSGQAFNFLQMLQQNSQVQNDE